MDAFCFGRRGQDRVFGGLKLAAASLLLSLSISQLSAQITPGTAYAWGNNSLGQAVVPSNLGKVIAISAGHFNNLAIRPDGTLAAWGSNASVPAGLPTLRAVAAGSFHSLALGNNGLVYEWGDDGVNKPPTGLSGVTAIAAGDSHSLALVGGKVVAWGVNDSGQASVPSSLANVMAIAAGDQHSVALRNNGSVVAWGNNIYGQAPGNVSISGVYTAIAAGANHGLALRSDGLVVGWGDNSYGQRTIPSDLGPVLAIAAGGNVSMAITTNHTVRVWGDSLFSQTSVPPDLSSGAVLISGGNVHCLAVRVDPPVITTQPDDVKALVTAPVSFSVTASGSLPLSYQWRYKGANILNATNASFSLTSAALTDAGTYSVWVTNSGGGVLSRSAVLTISDPPVITQQPVSADVGEGTTVLLQVKTKGSNPAYRWRKNGAVITGAINPFYNLPSLKPADSGNYDVIVTNVFGAVTSIVAKVTVHPLPKITRDPIGVQGLIGIAASLSGLASDADGYQWYLNDQPLAGAKSPNLELTPLAVANQGTYKLAATNAWGSVFSAPAAVILEAPATFSEVVGWGESQGWNGLQFVSLTPPVGLGGIFQVAAGKLHALVLRNNGTVWGWGDNSHAEAAAPAGLNGVTAIAAGDGFSVALKSSTAVVAWGRNDLQQTSVPSTASNVVAIAAGTSHAIALKNTGVVVAWGSNQDGESAVPGELAKTIAIAAGDGFNLALLESHTVTGWGRNDSGQTRPPQTLVNVEAIAAGRAHGLALVSGGTVVAWGNNESGQASVPPLSGKAIAIAAGADHSLAVLENGTVVAWGKDNAGQTDVPRDLAFVSSVSARGDHSLALRKKGIQFRAPELAAGKLRLTVASADGTPFDAARAAKIKLFATSNLTGGAATWESLGAPTLTDGVLKFLDPAAATASARFYRATEDP